ncbi:MAG: formate dehydrogenase accessory sulfurtransferase FdhD [Cohaesibacter sp.]|nr:formate dehydrogenase accessory sulfurtransferase FdhD [Cohaesibacter sp.]MCV6601500.1 formate dehydrogenase accessory sulfurtransferase FdhD [Cohaesibacter sp.]
MPQNKIKISDLNQMEPVAVSRLLPGKRITVQGIEAESWVIAEEMPVGVLVNGKDFAVMMLTPCDLEDFALGFALSEGLVSTPEQIKRIALTSVADGYLLNLSIESTGEDEHFARRRALAGRSSCGLCGAQSLAASVAPPPRVFGVLPEMRVVQKAFADFGPKQIMRQENHTTHAAALCDRQGNILLLREDIGRHNAVDKLTGAAIAAGHDTSHCFLMLSSRLSFEMVQKAAVLGVPLVAAVSAPSALALKLAKSADMHVIIKHRNELMSFDPHTLPETSP